MGNIFVQIYEIQTPEEAELMIRLGVNHIGTVLISREDWKSKRIKNTLGMVHEQGAVSSLITLFNDPDTVLKAMDYYCPDIVHFCEMLVEKKSDGSWGVDEGIINHLLNLQTCILQEFPQIKIMRSVPIASSGLGHLVPSLELAGIFEPVSHLFLTDTLLLSRAETNEQPVEGFVGITGTTCDWEVASMLVKNSRLPVILAGGISPDNVFEAILRVKPAGVDSCTLTNARSMDGIPIRFRKDPEKVAKLVREARKAEERLRVHHESSIE